MIHLVQSSVHFDSVAQSSDSLATSWIIACQVSLSIANPRVRSSSVHQAVMRSGHLSLLSPFSHLHPPGVEVFPIESALPWGNGQFSLYQSTVNIQADFLWDELVESPCWSRLSEVLPVNTSKNIKSKRSALYSQSHHALLKAMARLDRPLLAKVVSHLLRCCPRLVITFLPRRNLSFVAALIICNDFDPKIKVVLCFIVSSSIAIE